MDVLVGSYWVARGEFMGVLWRQITCSERCVHACTGGGGGGGRN